MGLILLLGCRVSPTTHAVQALGSRPSSRRTVAVHRRHGMLGVHQRVEITWEYMLMTARASLTPVPWRPSVHTQSENRSLSLILLLHTVYRVMARARLHGPSPLPNGERARSQTVKSKLPTATWNLLLRLAMTRKSPLCQSAGFAQDHELYWAHCMAMTWTWQRQCHPANPCRSKWPCVVLCCSASERCGVLALWRGEGGPQNDREIGRNENAWPPDCSRSRRRSEKGTIA